MGSTPRPWAGGIGVALIAALSSSQVARAEGQDLRYESAEQLYALSEVLAGGAPLWGELFEHGWPTDARHRHLTLELFGAHADALMAGYLGSGAGLPLSATSYEDRRAQRQKPSATTGQQLLRQELATYKQLSGATFNVPAAFDPVAIPFERARAELARAYDARDLASLRWREAPSSRHSLDALGFALLCEARYARQQLEHRREAAAGAKAKLWGRTPEGGFFGLVAAHCAVAKLHEVRRLVVDVRSEEFSARESLAALEDFRYFVPSGWTTSARAGGPDHALLPGDDRLKSHLIGLSALLLGACEMLALSDPEGPKELQALFSDKAPDGASAPLFEKDTFDVALDVALFAFRSMRAFHVNVIQGRATSLGGPTTRGTTITPTDLGLFLLALEGFKDRARIGGRSAERHPRYAEVQDEQRKADTLLRSLAAASFRAWDADEPGFYDLYSIANNSRQAQTKSLAAQALAVRGLLATHRHIAPGGESSPLLEVAERTLRWLDRERWDPGLGTYAEKAEKADQGGAPIKVPTYGAAATLGALRDMALTTGDGRYLTRYVQSLESLAARGLVRAPSDRTGAGLAAEVVFTGGSK